MFKKLARRMLKTSAVLVLLAVVGVAALFGFLALEHRTGVTLPPPTGPFAVGRTIEAWLDDSSVDTLAPVAGTSRELVVWTWYPTPPGQSAAVTNDYLPPLLRTEFERRRGTLISDFLTRDLSKVRPHSVGDANVSPQQPSYPVVIMRAGASSEVGNYSTLAEDLASHGYIVIGFDAPYRTGVTAFPDGRVINGTPENNPEGCLGQQSPGRELCADRLIAAWNADTRFVLDRLTQRNISDATGKFTGRLDMSRVGVFGHSFGGATSAQFCHEDARCKAGIDVDGALHGSVIQAGLQQPFMFLLSDHGEASDPESRQILANIHSVYERQPAGGRLRIAIRGANHFTFSDDGALLKSRVMRGVLRLFGGLRLDGRRQLAVTTYSIRSFFDAYLKGTNASRLHLSTPLYPEIHILD